MNKSDVSYIYKNKRGHKFEITPAAAEQMVQFMQNNLDTPEAGGVLLGRFIINSRDVVVDKVTVPLVGDKRSKFRFFRSQQPHQARIDEEWENSGGTCNYLGEWHTHPEPNPTPSLCDLVDWKKKLLFDSFDGDTLYFVILGTENINIWQGIRKRLTFKQLIHIP